jgi:diguanylate cyclase (GGDEF)-like protein/PAS domain S-box-containing protein
MVSCTDMTKNSNNSSSVNHDHSSLLADLRQHSHLGYLRLESKNLSVIDINNRLKNWVGFEISQYDFDLHEQMPDLVSKLKQAQSYYLPPISKSFQVNILRFGIATHLSLQCLPLSLIDKESAEIHLIFWIELRGKQDNQDQPDDKNKITAIDHLLEYAPVGLFRLTPDWQCDYVNQQFCLLTEMSQQELLGQGWTRIFAQHKERLTELVSSLLSKISVKSQINFHIPGKNLRVLEYEMQVHLAASGEIDYIIGTLTDVSEREEKLNEIHHLSTYDTTTGLYNRRALKKQFSRYLQLTERISQSLYLAIIGIDGFKTINDFYGHEVGDSLLRAVGKRIKKYTRTSDIVARFSGDEFAILMPGDLTEADMMDTLEALTGHLSQTYRIDENEINLSMSAGITAYFNKAKSHEVEVDLLMSDLFKQADIALIVAKQESSNKISRFIPSQNEQLVSLYNIVKELPHAISNQEFRVHYQPIVAANDLTTQSYEALIRWNSLTLGFVAPDQFISIAESKGYIEQVEACVLERIAADMSSLLKTVDAKKLRVAINLSGLQLCSLRLLKSFVKTAEALKLEPQMITLEITEQVFVIEDADVLKHMLYLKDIGFKFALDDFGTGFCSLSYLTRFPIDYVKLDRSFVSNIVDDNKQHSLVAGLISLCKALDLKVIAEGVETKPQYEILKAMGCDSIQGYYLAKPMPVDLLETWKVRDHG